MRKIETKEEKERKEKRKNIILSLILAGILVFSTIGYAILSRHEEEQNNLKVKVNGRDFYFYSGMWAIQKDGKVLYFNNLPNETKDVLVSDLRGINYFGKKVYFVNSQQPAYLIVNNIKEIEIFQEACLDEKCSEEKNLPIKNCTDHLIVFRDGNETKVLKEENCIFLEGDFNKAADAFMYKLLDIN
ncbi:MAG: hypothetical protein QXX68_00135 [Candidatus Pacearchaeota archaeon]